MMRGDRIFGAVMIVVALGYIFSAAQIQTSFMTDPVGPKTFPFIVGGVVILCSLVLVIKPDEEPEWPAAATFVQLLICLAILIGYALTIKPLGFIVPTMIASGIISWQISGNPKSAVLSGVGLSLGLFVLFRFVLGLSLRGLPAGMGL